MLAGYDHKDAVYKYLKNERQFVVWPSDLT